MVIQKLKSGAEVDDAAFDAIYPDRWKKISKIHFSPVKVAQVAARFLVEKPSTRVLDIGSGAGKFCMVGAASTEGHFVGVEQRANLHRLAKKLAGKYELANTDFIHANITDLDFEAFDAFYCFNAFYENVFPQGSIDNAITLDRELYLRYTQYMREQLDKMPVGTRLATYFSFMHEVPDSYIIRSVDFDLKLKLWQKE